MTNQEAIEILSSMDCDDPEVADIKEAVNKAVAALTYADYMSKQHNCNDCGLKKTCAIRPDWGDVVRVNCAWWREEESRCR